MTDNRNNKDWTDALRERLDTSALSPSSDIWSKVESRSGLAAQGTKAGRKPVFAWTAACAVAAALALFLVLSPFRTVPTAASGLMAEEDPVSVVPAADLVEEIDILPAEHILVAEAALPVKRTAAPSEQAVVYDEVSAAAETPSETPVAGMSNEPVPETTEPAVAEPETVAGEAASQWDDFFTEPAAAPKRKVRLSMSVAGISGASGAGNGLDHSDPPISDFPNDGYNGGSSISSGVDDGANTKAIGTKADKPSLGHHYRPVRLGLALTYPVADRWFLESGLNYSYLRTDIEVDSRGQKLHFLGVPLKVGYVLGASSQFSVSLSAGAMAEKLVYGEIFGKEITIRDPQFSAIATAAVQYRIGNGLYLFLAPEFSYYLTETAVQSYHTEHPASLTLRLGVNVNLGSAR